MSEIGVGIAGFHGRMGQAVAAAIAETEGCRLAGALVSPGARADGSGPSDSDVALTDDPAALFAGADAVIDFTRPAATRRLAEAAAGQQAAYIVGTTGLTEADQDAIDRAARAVPVVQAANFSLGVNLLLRLVEQAAATLDDRFDIEILDLHHRHKVDAPSGTALALGRAAAAGRDVDLQARAVRVRDGRTGPRRSGDIGFAVLRGGTVAGEHAVTFAGPDERLELGHKAADRSVFAHGALTAARWAVGRPPGLYAMSDVLGL